MKSSEVKFRFPVLGFTTDGDLWGFPDMERLTKCGPRTLKEGLQNGMELVDAGLRRWRVQSVRRMGRAGPFWSYLLIFGPPQSRVEHELEPMPPVTLAEVQDRVCAAQDKFAKIDYYGEEGEAEYRATERAVRRAKSVTRIYNLLEPDTFEPY